MYSSNKRSSLLLLRDERSVQIVRGVQKTPPPTPPPPPTQPTTTPQTNSPTRHSRTNRAMVTRWTQHDSYRRRWRHAGPSRPLRAHESHVSRHGHPGHSALAATRTPRAPRSPPSSVRSLLGSLDATDSPRHVHTSFSAVFPHDMHVLSSHHSSAPTPAFSLPHAQVKVALLRASLVPV
jgi:hypothetical protein